MKILLIISVAIFIASFVIARSGSLRAEGWFARTIGASLLFSGLSSVIAFLWLLF